MSKLSFRARALDASKPMPIYLAEELPDLPDYSAINRAVPQMPSGMEKEEECEHHLQRAICTGLIIPTPEVCPVSDLEFYERCYPPDYKMPKQHIHMQPLWQEQEQPEYDIDTEDERWLKQQRHPELTDLKFEQMMDKLERSSGQTVVTLNEAKLLLERQDDLVIAVYDYWLNKRLKTQHPLILSVKTESRPGQSSNNPYLAFRRRTEKMQTRKNRKNDESSYEKMLKLRRDLARALTLLELVARRERAKRDLVRLTALLTERRYHAQDYAGLMLADIPHSRGTYVSAGVSASGAGPGLGAGVGGAGVGAGGGAARYRGGECYSLHYGAPRASRAVPEPALCHPDLARTARQKRPYKRRKHRHHGDGTTQGLRDSGVYTSSEEEGSSRAEAATPPDDGPYAFRRKPGCYYEMPTATLYGDPVDPENTSKDAVYQHELDDRLRYTLTSVNHPYQHCVGFARRRVGRGGRVLLERVSTTLDSLWQRVPFSFPSSTRYKAERAEEVELETEQHRNPKELSRDYHSSGKHPWRHSFRQHLALEPHLWIPAADRDNSDISLSDRTVQCGVVNVTRSGTGPGSGCSDSSYDSDEPLYPVEVEAAGLIDEVHRKWLHFRPKTPPPARKSPSPMDLQPLTADTRFSVDVDTASDLPSHCATFTTSEFTLGHLYGDIVKDEPYDLDLIDDNLGLTEDQVESILSKTDLKALAEGDDKKMITDDILEELGNEDTKDPFLSHGQSQTSGQAHSGPGLRTRRHRDSFGSTLVTVAPMPDQEPIYVEKLPEVKVKVEPPVKQEVVKVKQEAPPAPPAAPQPAPPAGPPTTTAHITLGDLQQLTQVKLEPKKVIAKPTAELSPLTAVTASMSAPATLATPVTMATLAAPATPASPGRKAGARRDSVAVLTGHDATRHQILTVAVSDTLRVRLQNHMLSSQASSSAASSTSSVLGLNVLQNGPYTHDGGHLHRDLNTVSVSVAGSSSPRRVTAPLVHLAPSPSPLVVSQSHTIQHLAPNKLKVLHAHPLTQSQRSQLLAQTRPPNPAHTAHPALPAHLQLKAAPGAVAQFFEIKGQLGKGPHLVNVVRQPTVARLDLNDAKKRQLVAFDGALKGNIATATRPHRVSVSLDGRQIVRAGLPSIRPPVRHQIHLKNRTLQVARSTETGTSITIAAPSKSTSIPGSVVANLLQKNVQLPKIAISSAAGQALAANVQAIAFTTAQLKARQARLIAQPRPIPVAEIVEASTAAVVPSTSTGITDAPIETVSESEPSTNGAVRRRQADNLPMEVT